MEVLETALDNFIESMASRTETSVSQYADWKTHIVTEAKKQLQSNSHNYIESFTRVKMLNRTRPGVYTYSNEKNHFFVLVNVTD